MEIESSPCRESRHSRSCRDCADITCSILRQTEDSSMERGSPQRGTSAFFLVMFSFQSTEAWKPQPRQERKPHGQRLRFNTRGRGSPQPSEIQSLIATLKFQSMGVWKPPTRTFTASICVEKRTSRINRNKPFVSERPAVPRSRRLHQDVHANTISPKPRMSRHLRVFSRSFDG